MLLLSCILRQENPILALLKTGKSYTGQISDDLKTDIAATKKRYYNTT